MRTEARNRQRGQVLVLTVFMVVAILFVTALLFDGAQLLVNRRVMQDASDVGALAGANLLQTQSCSTATSAAVSATTTQLASGAFTAAPSVTASCPDSSHVQVNVSGISRSFFAPFLAFAVAGAPTGGIPVSAQAQAVNGPETPKKFSVVELNPYNATWQSGLRGCPSVLFSGGPTITFEGSLHTNSACPAANGGALGTNGNAATIQFLNGTYASMTGGYSPGPLTISPTPRTGQPILRDPLRNLPAMGTCASVGVKSPSQLTINGTSVVLQPGCYVGGIRLMSSAKVYLLPGVYILDRGGLDVGSQASLFSIPTSLAAIVPPTSATTWATDCPTSTCGVLIYNTASSGAMGQISIGAGGTVLLRPYQSAVDGTTMKVAAYNNLLIWQDRLPVPTSNSIQPQINLNGGGTINISGTLYAPSAKVYMTGGSGGSGGNSVDLTLQFVTWDLQIQGNSNFYFHYSSGNFARPIQYGLVQ